MEKRDKDVVPANTFPTAYKDVAAGIEWVYRNIGNSIKSGQGFSLVLAGHSAGAHLNGLVLLKDPTGEKYGLSFEAKTKISKVISVEGIYDLKLLAESCIVGTVTFFL